MEFVFAIWKEGRSVEGEFVGTRIGVCGESDVAPSIRLECEEGRL